MSSRQTLQSSTEDRKYFIEIIKADEEELANSLEEMSICTYGNLSSDFVRSINQAQENFQKKIRLHAFSSQTVEGYSSIFGFEIDSPMNAIKKTRYLNAVGERFYGNSAKAFKDVLKKRKANTKSSCSCVIA